MSNYKKSQLSLMLKNKIYIFIIEIERNVFLCTCFWFHNAGLQFLKYNLYVGTWDISNFIMKWPEKAQELCFPALTELLKENTMHNSCI